MRMRFAGQVELLKEWACKHEEVVVNITIGGVSPIAARRDMLEEVGQSYRFFNNGGGDPVSIELNAECFEGRWKSFDGSEVDELDGSCDPAERGRLTVGDVDLFAKLEVLAGQNVVLVVADDVQAPSAIDYEELARLVGKWVLCEGGGMGYLRLWAYQATGISKAGHLTYKSKRGLTTAWMNPFTIVLTADDEATVRDAQAQRAEQFAALGRERAAQIKRLVDAATWVLFCDCGGAPYVGQLKADPEGMTVEWSWCWTPAPKLPKPIAVPADYRLLSQAPTQEQLAAFGKDAEQASANTLQATTEKAQHDKWTKPGAWPFWTWPDIEAAAAKAGLQILQPPRPLPTTATEYIGA